MLTYTSNYRQDANDLKGMGYDHDAVASVTIDAWDDTDDTGHVVAEIFKTQHGDIVVSWHENGARMNETVLQMIRDAITEFKSQEV